MDSIREKIKDYIEQDEDVLSYALLPQVAETFFKQRKAGFPAPQPTTPVVKEAAKEVSESAKTNNGDVTAVISGVIAAMEEEDNAQYLITSICQSGVSPWVLSSRLRM